MRTVDDVIRGLPLVRIGECEAPPYRPNASSRKIMLAVEAMSRHMSNAGWQLTTGLRDAGYQLCGRDCEVNEVDVPQILRKTNPGTCVVQDKREWDGKTAAFRDSRVRFRRVEELKNRNDIFKLTVLKDAQQAPAYHKQSADEMGVHGWITYYHPRIVKHVAPYVRRQHCVRTYHTLDAKDVPEFSNKRDGCLLSGALSTAYPLRLEFYKHKDALPNTVYRRHPGYHANGCVTSDYLKALSQFKVALCTSSMYGYTLRKHIEATACGCVVLTDLPVDDPLPEIDGNLVRIDGGLSRPARMKQVRDTIKRLISEYDPERQRMFAERAKRYYDWRVSGVRLSINIESLRQRYAG